MGIEQKELLTARLERTAQDLNKVQGMIKDPGGEIWPKRFQLAKLPTQTTKELEEYMRSFVTITHAFIGLQDKTIPALLRRQKRLQDNLERLELSPEVRLLMCTISHSLLSHMLDKDANQLKSERDPISLIKLFLPKDMPIACIVDTKKSTSTEKDQAIDFLATCIKVTLEGIKGKKMAYLSPRERQVVLTILKIRTEENPTVAIKDLVDKTYQYFGITDNKDQRQEVFPNLKAVKPKKNGKNTLDDIAVNPSTGLPKIYPTQERY